MGVGTIMQARRVILMAWGEKGSDYQGYRGSDGVSDRFGNFLADAF
ncbi:MAG: hypothetical protein ACLU4N_00430 [Butyricimonas faecihominis]